MFHRVLNTSLLFAVEKHFAALGKIRLQDTKHQKLHVQSSKQRQQIKVLDVVLNLAQHNNPDIDLTFFFLTLKMDLPNG